MKRNRDCAMQVVLVAVAMNDEGQTYSHAHKIQHSQDTADRQHPVRRDSTLQAGASWDGQTAHQH
jgi:hypothetical protein